MNSEARKMMLLGSIDGVIDDLPKMLKVPNEREVACLHSGDNSNAVFTLGAGAVTVGMKVFNVELKPLNFGRTRVGAIGICACGKIYYTEE